MNKYLLLEIGKSAYTEFKMKDGSFVETQDAIVVDEVEAHSKEEAYEKVITSSQHKVFHRLVVRQVL